VVKQKILIQLDSDPQPSVFDRVVAVDAGADEIFSYGGVKPEQVRDLVHGAIFTRKPDDLKSTAIFIGGSNVAAGEALLAEVQKHMLPGFGLRVSILLDANGANTTAAAAVFAASQHISLSSAPVLVLGGTGPVGQRVARLMAGKGAHVRVASRQLQRAAQVCDAIRTKISGAVLEPAATSNDQELLTALQGRIVVIVAGAAGAVLLPHAARSSCKTLKVAIDLNAVPPLGVEGVQVHEKAMEHEGVICYGAIGVGNTKMKLHRAAVARLFEGNDQVMDAEEVYGLTSTLG
jgi:hypothetical protein